MTTDHPASPLDLTSVLDPSVVEASASEAVPRSRFRAAVARLMSSMVEGLAAYGHARHMYADFYHIHPDYWDFLHDESRWSETRYRHGELP
jgi:hypothetical protein